MSDADPATPEPDTEPTVESPDTGGVIGSDRVTDYLLVAGIVVLALTAAVALAGFYTAVSSVIRVWVTREFQPLVNAAFNLSLLAAALAGIGLLLRRRS